MGLGLEDGLGHTVGLSPARQVRQLYCVVRPSTSLLHFPPETLRLSPESMRVRHSLACATPSLPLPFRLPPAVSQTGRLPASLHQILGLRRHFTDHVLLEVLDGSIQHHPGACRLTETSPPHVCHTPLATLRLTIRRHPPGALTLASRAAEKLAWRERERRMEATISDLEMQLEGAPFGVLVRSAANPKDSRVH